MPVSPNIYRVRTDLSWQDVVDNELKDHQHLSGMSVQGRWRKEKQRDDEDKRDLSLILLIELSVTQGFKASGIGHWSIKNMRMFLERFAKQRNMDPLYAETWYQIPYKAFHQFRVR